jgi:hypothetical protein
MARMTVRFLILLAAALAATGTAGAASLPDAVSAAGETVLLDVHAEGAQIYECAAGPRGLAWKLREPIATLLADGKTVGRHYAGPSWELTDSSAIEAKPAGRAPGAGPQDIPLLKLDVTTHRGRGTLAAATTVQRLDTKGGNLEGPCAVAGETRAVPYSAEYRFLKR